MTLPLGSLTIWEGVYKSSWENSIHIKITSDLRTKITTFSQMKREPFYKVWDSFKLLLIQCPYHHFPLQLQNQIFYDGMTRQCQFTVYNVEDKAIVERTTYKTYEIYEMLVANSQHKSARVRRA